LAVILLIDDDAFFRGVYRRMLERGGHTVIEAEGGHQGIALYSQHRPDVAIVDIFMPDLEGGEVICRLRQLDADARVIAISGHSGFHDDVAYVDRVKALGAQAILRKIESREIVLAAVEKVARPTALKVRHSTR
jgi:CheY-like chemotaxis protein